MSDLLQHSALGQGIYTVPEASRLTGISSQRLRRWLRGYQYRIGKSTNHSNAIFKHDFENTDILQLSFLDMIEARVIDAFLRYGVGWKELRRASTNAARLMGTSHPFATFRFRTDGRQIFAEIIDDKSHDLVALRDSQHVFRQIVNPSLKNMDFDDADAHASRWWPLGKKRSIVIDPDRAMGKPIGVRSGIPTYILAEQTKVSSTQEIIDWYGADKREIHDAIEFETGSAA